MNTAKEEGWNRVGNIYARRAEENATSVVIETWDPWNRVYHRELYRKDGHLEMFVGYTQ